MKKYIIAALLSMATLAGAATVDIGQTLTFEITATQAEYEVVGYDVATGDWRISVTLILNEPDVEASFRVRTSYDCTITAAEIAAYLGVEPGTVSENFTGDQINQAVTAIAFQKVLAAYGVTQ